MKESPGRPDYDELCKQREAYKYPISARLAWGLVTAVCLVTALILFINGYGGYTLILLAVGLSAAVNLLPDRSCKLKHETPTASRDTQPD